MRIGGNANLVVHVTSKEELRQAYQTYKNHAIPIYVIGGGSNLIAHDEGFAGVIIKNEISGIQLIENTPTSATVKASSGEGWDVLVKYTVDAGLSGIEALSGIPGTVGAAPVQNIGAYGQELSDTLLSLEAYDTQNDTFVTLTWEECELSYRYSIFKGREAGRYVITSISLMLRKQPPQPPFYDSLQKYLESYQLDTENLTVQIIRSAVLAIRQNKLPDPMKRPNSGSFFKNVIVERWKANDLATTHTDMPTFPVDDEHVKIPAGWLIEAVGLKGEVLNGMKVHDGNAVVLINESANSYANLAAAREKIISRVFEKFSIRLEQEPLELSS
jgi:UDP-N-acetylmuramate dehydrogenase